MIGFIIENIGTIIVGLILLVVVGAIIRKMVRDVRNGKSISCDCGCSTCPHSEGCHTIKK